MAPKQNMADSFFERCSNQIFIVIVDKRGP